MTPTTARQHWPPGGGASVLGEGNVVRFSKNLLGLDLLDLP